MSLPDVDYELRDMGQFEYGIPLMNAKTPEDMQFTANAFRAGQKKERERIETELIAEAKGRDNLQIAIFKLKNIIYNTKHFNNE
jgi:hypothetical protein